MTVADLNKAELSYICSRTAERLRTRDAAAGRPENAGTRPSREKTPAVDSVMIVVMFDESA